MSLPKDSPCKPQAHGTAAPGGGPCPSCRRPRCSAAAKSRPGERCRKNPHPGATICTNHGLTEAGRAKAAGVVAGREAEKALAELVPLISAAEPIKDPIDLLARSLTVMEQVADRLAERVNGLNGHLATGESLAQIRAEVAFWERTQDRIISGASKLAALGIAERQVELAAGQADLVVAAFRAGLAVAGSTLLPDVRDAMLRGFLEALGQSSVPPELGAAS